MADRRIVVLGAGGHGKVVADVARSAGYAVEAFVDDDPQRAGGTFFGLPVWTWAQLVASPETPVALGIGEPAARALGFARCATAGLELSILVHRDASVAPTASLGAGTVVMAQAVINPDAVVGQGVIVNSGAIVEHDCTLEDFSHVSPGAALGGAVRIGARSHVGLGAALLPGVSIGADVRVGAGAVVLRDVPDGATVAGVPARVLGRAAGGTS